ncbi:TPA: helix-turn-helix domain-containing protein [Streptococcus pyogenes]|uniref:helix-turn-helix domain-containing protein n=2 Tax=Streptococcus pyogenes TaxID=1314 RepID=UPI00109D1DA4|nr:helix-turn-helix domain-containing protein [Streptococcus pyogenes]HEP2113314.1 helix-turn-helix domain-containing protein [Streptococcus pyogenes]HEP2429413.1 helix-turn-helix domain-containing protein [Streptococcus pyogenes]HEQ8343662.1 helix-turn-helix domain-containing protein [Streptococcus pyogenes]HEQ9159970.1 helix-turn-helix domain-containing protein [Streptococcus pyogenes]
MILVGGSKQKMTVGNLFTTKQWRELELIALLTKSQKPLYYKDVCEKLDCSLLTFISQLFFINIPSL